MDYLSLDNFLLSIADSVRKASEYIRQEHFNNFKSTFFSGNQAKSSVYQVPRTHFTEENKNDPYVNLSFPNAAFVDHKTIEIDTLSFDIDASLEYVKDSNGDLLIALRVGNSTAGKEGTVKLSINFKLSEPSEGFARLNDRLLTGL